MAAATTYSRSTKPALAWAGGWGLAWLADSRCLAAGWAAGLAWPSISAAHTAAVPNSTVRVGTRTVRLSVDKPENWKETPSSNFCVTSCILLLLTIPCAQPHPQSLHYL